MKWLLNPALHIALPACYKCTCILEGNDFSKNKITLGLLYFAKLINKYNRFHSTHILGLHMSDYILGQF